MAEGDRVANAIREELAELKQKEAEISQRVAKYEQVLVVLEGEPAPKATSKHAGSDLPRIRVPEVPIYAERAMKWARERPGEKFQAVDVRRELNIHPRSVSDIMTYLVDRGELRQIGERKHGGKRARYVYEPEQESGVEVIVQ